MFEFDMIQCGLIVLFLMVLGEMVENISYYNTKRYFGL